MYQRIWNIEVILLKNHISCKFRRKYELLQFYNATSQNSTDNSFSKRSSSCSQSSNPSSKNGSHDKRHYEKQATRHRIGHAFRNSRVRRDGDHKSFDKSSPAVSRQASVITAFSITDFLQHLSYPSAVDIKNSISFSNFWLLPSFSQFKILEANNFFEYQKENYWI